MKTHIVIHHSFTADSVLFMNMEAIRKYHVEVNGWRDIGYSHVVEQIGGFWEVLLGRIPADELAHEPHLNLNRVGYGICVIGNYDDAAPPPEALAKLRLLVLELMRTDNIPVENVFGHREAQAAGGVPIAERKTCPGKLFDMDAFRASLKVAV